MDVAAWSGLIRSRQRRREQPAPRGIQAKEAEDFGDWADEVWTAVQPEYAMAAVRDARTLQQLYPAREPRFCAPSRLVRLALLLDTPCKAISISATCAWEPS